MWALHEFHAEARGRQAVDMQCYLEIEPRSILGGTGSQEQEKKRGGLLNPGIRARIYDAGLLVSHERYEGALLSLLVGIAGASAEAYPNLGDRERFERYLGHKLANVLWRRGGTPRTPEQGSGYIVNFNGIHHPIEHLLYKWYRCCLVHEAGLAECVALEFIPDTPGMIGFRVSNDGKLSISTGILKVLVQVLST